MNRQQVNPENLCDACQAEYGDRHRTPSQPYPCRVPGCANASPDLASTPAPSDAARTESEIETLRRRGVRGKLVPCPRGSESPDIRDENGQRVFMAFWGAHPPTPEATAAEEDRIYSTIEALCAMWNSHQETQ